MASKDCCELMSNWEASDNKKVSSVLHIEKVTDDIMSMSASGDCCVDRQLSTEANITGTSSVPVTPAADGPAQQPDKEFSFAPIQLKPFLHPEMTKASQCELRLLISPRHHLRIVKLVVISVARCIEVYDRLGEYLMTIKGDKLTKHSTNVDVSTSTAPGTQPSYSHSALQKVSSSNNGTVQPHESSKTSSHRWFRCVYVPAHDTFEVIIRITGSPEPNVLYLRYLGLYVTNHDWNEINILSNSFSGSALSSPLINMDRLQEILAAAASGHTGEGGGVGIGQRQRSISLYSSQTNQVLASLIAASQSHSGAVRSSSPNMPPESPLTSGLSRPSMDYSQLRTWLDTRLSSMESNLTQKLEALAARLDSLEANFQSKTKSLQEH